jgi:NAD(P)H-dependent FMN reductase
VTSLAVELEQKQLEVLTKLVPAATVIASPIEDPMANRILVFYGSYRSNRMGFRLAQYVVERLRRRGEDAELIDAKAINLPMLDRMYKEYPKGEAPEALERLAGKIRDADGFVFVTGEYNWGVQPD